MKVEYARRAVSDLLSLAAYYAGADDPGVAERIAARVRDVVARIAVAPESGRVVPQRGGLLVVSLMRYPYVIFYRITDKKTVRIVHIRHTSRRPWTGN